MLIHVSADAMASRVQSGFMRLGDKTRKIATR